MAQVIRAKTGETLQSIAKKYGVSVQALTAANPQLKRSTGQYVVYGNSNVRIPGTPTGVPGTTPKVRVTDPVTGNTYLVDYLGQPTSQGTLVSQGQPTTKTPSTDGLPSQSTDTTTKMLDLYGPEYLDYLTSGTESATNLLRGQADIIRQSREEQARLDAAKRNVQASQYNAGITAQGTLAGQHGVSGGGGLGVAARREAATPYIQQQMGLESGIQTSNVALNKMYQNYIDQYNKAQQAANKKVLKADEILNRLYNPNTGGSI